VTEPQGVLIYGAGGHESVVLDAARSLVGTERVRRYIHDAVARNGCGALSRQNRACAPS
jgi:hypothetical protein